MKITAYPYVQHAFEEIMMDSGAPRGMFKLVKSDVQIDAALLAMFELTEKWLAEAGKFKFKEVKLPKRQRKQMLEDGITDEDSVFSLIVCPCNDQDEWLLKALGATALDIKCVKHILCEFFDGELSEVFQQRQPEKSWKPAADKLRREVTRAIKRNKSLH